jgi:hypothetical protein
MTSRPSTAAPILAVLAVVLVTLGAYVAGYFSLGERADLSGGDFIRSYGHPLLETFFRPAASIESLFRGVNVFSGLPDDDGRENPEFDFRFARDTFDSPYPWGFSGPPANPKANP